MRNNPRKKKQMMISAAIVVCVAVIVAGYFIKSAKDREALKIGRIQRRALQRKNISVQPKFGECVIPWY